MTGLIGTVVVATAGRDKGRSLVVMDVCDDAHVYIADGKTRKAASPKKKKLMHLRFTPSRIEMNAKPADPGAMDAWLRKSLQALCAGDQTTSKEG